MATDGRFIMPLMPDGVPNWLTRSEARLAEKAIATGLSSVADIAGTQLALGAVDRLIGRGLLTLAAFTPTDALHVSGDFTEFDADAARLGAALMARQKNGVGNPMATTPEELASITLAELHRRTGLALMDAALAHDGAGEGQASANPLLKDLYRDAGSSDDGLVSISLDLGVGVVGLGASAGTHYPHVARIMGVALTVPEHANVAGAVGAAAGSVRQRVMISVTQPSEGRFRVHLADGPKDLADMDAALDVARQAASELARDRALQAGAARVTISLDEDIKLVPLSADHDLFVEALIHAIADGHAS